MLYLVFIRITGIPKKEGINESELIQVPFFKKLLHEHKETFSFNRSGLQRPDNYKKLTVLFIPLI